MWAKTARKTAANMLGVKNAIGRTIVAELAGIRLQYLIRGLRFYQCEGTRIIWRLTDEKGVDIDIMTHSQFKIIGVMK
jgi:hypothetical protein